MVFATPGRYVSRVPSRSSVSGLSVHYTPSPRRVSALSPLTVQSSGRGKLLPLGVFFAGLVANRKHRGSASGRRPILVQMKQERQGCTSAVMLRHDLRVLPAPPAAPPHLLEFNVGDYIGNFMLSIGLTVLCTALAHLAAMPLFFALAGAMAVPLMHLQHNIRHLKQSQKSFEVEALANIAGVFTGSNLTGPAWDVHKRHHAKAGEYLGWSIDTAFAPMGKTLWDLDDLVGPLRNGNPICDMAIANEAIRVLVAGFMLLASSVLVHAISFPAQSLVPLASLKFPLGPKDYEVLQRAALGILHLSIGLVCLGPLGFLLYSIGFSVAETNCNVVTHDPKGSGHYEAGRYWDLQLASTTNFAHHDNWLVRHMYMGDDYHIEHHLWPDVPETNLHKLAPVARHYCEVHGLPYREVGLLEAWQSWWDEAYKLAGTPYAPGSAMSCSKVGGQSMQP